MQKNIDISTEGGKIKSSCVSSSEHTTPSFTNSKSIFINIVLYSSLFFSSCSKFVEVGSPSNQIVGSLVFVDDITATSAMVGLYSNMMSANTIFANAGITIPAGLSADEFVNSSPNAALDPIASNAIPANNTLIQNNVWKVAYNYIYQANAILEGVQTSQTISSATKQTLTGEAKFVRAFCYFYLTNIFGDVPLIISTNYISNATVPRTPSLDIYKLIIADLIDAKSKLPENYITNTAFPSQRIRPNKLAATALLARVYLYLGEWGKTESEATLVINSPQYRLVRVDSVFLSSSNEAIFQLFPVMTSNSTGEGSAFVPATNAVKPTYIITNFLLNAFANGDLRKSNWIKSNTVNSQIYSFPNKYKIRSSTSSPTEYNIVLRLGEQYLIRAEARGHQNDIVGGYSDLNKIRIRAGLPSVSTSNQDSLLLAIQKERQVELFAEWGHRWLDLKRTHTIDQVLGAAKAPNWQPTDALYPIPFLEIQRNPFLTQNPGY
jgi:starch-binding outer membrane protein, SusD/RagB family